MVEARNVNVTITVNLDTNLTDDELRCELSELIWRYGAHRNEVLEPVRRKVLHPAAL